MKAPSVLAPLTPPDLDLRDFPYMPLDVMRLRDSDLAALASGEEFRAAVMLWCASWHQIPAASIPTDEVVLAKLAGYGRDTKGWKKVRDGALRGFVECSDGRLYHPVIADKANEALEKKTFQKSRTMAATEARQRKRHGQRDVERDDQRDGQRNVVQIEIEKEIRGREGSVSLFEEKSSTARSQGELQVSNGAQPGPMQPDPTEQERQLFERGKAVLGKTAGGLIKKLLEANGGNVALARSAIETASTKQNPREVIGAILRNRELPPQTADPRL